MLFPKIKVTYPYIPFGGALGVSTLSRPINAHTVCADEHAGQELGQFLLQPISFSFNSVFSVVDCHLRLNNGWKMREGRKENDGEKKAK